MARTDTVHSHHQKKKKKKRFCQPRWACVTITILAILLVGVSAAIPAILLTKTTTTKPRPMGTAVLRWNATGITIAGVPGVANITGFDRPYGLGFDSAKDLYVADYGHNRIVKLVGSTLVTVGGRADGVLGTSSNELNLPVHMLFDANDNMYICDRINTRIQLWARSATSGTTVAGSGSSTNISLFGPSTIRQGPDSGTMFISDTFAHRIVSYPSGRVVVGGNGAGAGSTQLFNPYGLIYDSISNSLLIPNYDISTLVRWVVGDNQSTPMIGNASAPGGGGSTSLLLNRPVGITMDPMGNVYVADSDNHRIQFSLAGQSNGTTIAGTTGVSGLAANQLNSPYWVEFDSQLNMYVSDTLNHRVQKFLRY